jgi:hypothetical protein
LYRAVLQSDGSKCLTADDADLQSPGVTPSQSPTAMKSNLNSWKNSNEFLEVPLTSSPKLRRHLSGSDGNLAVAGLSESSRGVIRRASCNERKTKSKHENSYRRPRTDSKVTRSTSDPHNKPAREDVLHPDKLSRSSSVKHPNTITENELQMLTETSIDLESPRSATSISEVDLMESVDMDEIQMSLSPENEVAPSVSPHPPNSEKESSEKLKLLLAQKLSKAPIETGKDGETSPRESTKRSSRSHGERKRVPRSSSVERGRKLGERKLAMDAGQVELVTSEMKDGRKTKLARSSSGSRQLPDPSQISGKSRGLPRTEGSENVDGALCNGVEIPGNSSRPKNDPQDPVDASEHARSSAQAPPIKAPLIASLALSRNGSNATETSRKRNQLSKRSSPVLSRKSPDLVRKSMDDQLLEPRTSPPLRRAKSEADTPLENLRHKSRHSRNSDATKNSEHSRNADGKCATNTAVHSNEGTMSRNSEHSRNSDGNHSKNSENSRYGDKTRPRSRKTLTDHDSTRRSSAGDDIVSKKLMNLSQDGNISNSTNSLAQEDTGSNGTNAGDKPRRQMKKYRGREHRKPTEVDGKVSSVDGSQHLEPLMLEST